MRILFVSSEVFPFSKTGGLADVAGALPQALAALGHDVLVVSPWYQTLAASPLWIGDTAVPFDGDFEYVGIGTLERDGIGYVFVSHDAFQRDRLYGFADDVQRFCLFTRTVPAAANLVGFRPHVVHANDWHSGYLPLVLEHGRHLPEGFPDLPSIYTVHNIQFQGVSGLEKTAHWLRLPSTVTDGYMNHFGSANAMQAALGHASRVTTVSPSYADEIQSQAFGFGLDGTLRHIKAKLSGILNGLDTTVWDPQTDPFLNHNFGPASLAGKAAVQAGLRHDLGFHPQRPVLALISRLADQKGIDLLFAGAERLLAQGWSLALLGSGDPGLEEWMTDFAEANPASVFSLVGFDEGLAHRLYGGADALAIPSRFEPCGLSQMIAMRYGTLPLARATGGLRDTIVHGETGFLFAEATSEALVAAAGEAMTLTTATRWRQMIAQAMQQDFSWQASASHYDSLYREVVQA